MKKILLTLAVTLLFVFPLCSCGTEVPAALTGEWECQDSSYGCEAGYGYLALRIEENGHFSLYDAEAGNPGISGTMKGAADALTGTVEISCESDDFDPPACWEIEEKDTLEFEAVTPGRIKLSHNGKSLSFANYISEDDFTSFSLADRSENYKWEYDMKGDGKIKLKVTTEPDPDAVKWQHYTVRGISAGDVLLTMKYRSGDDIMYTVTFDLTVTDDGTVRENGRDGDIDDTMTS